MKTYKKILALAAAATCAAAITVVAQTGVVQQYNPNIRLNTVGYRTGYPMIATLADSSLNFAVRRAGESANLFVKPVPTGINNSDTRERVWLLDFTEELREHGAGSYQIVTTDGLSPVFHVADDVFEDTYRMLMLGMYLWRCGESKDVTVPVNVTSISPGANNRLTATTTSVRQRYQHNACHLNDGTVHELSGLLGAGTRRDGTGGWHDAGDYNKYVVNSGVTNGLMLKAWENFHHVLDNTPLIEVNGNGMPAFLEEVKYNIDWVSKMVFDDGWVSHKLTTLRFGGNIRPEAEGETRYFIMAGSTSTATAAAILAQAARIYAPYIPEIAEMWLEQARRAYDVVLQSEFVNVQSDGHTKPEGNPSVTGAYDTGSDIANRMWAAAELWETTGEQRYLDHLEDRYDGELETDEDGNTIGTFPNARRANLGRKNATTGVWAFRGGAQMGATTEWGSVANLAYMTYFNSRRDGRDEELVSLIQTRLIDIANTVVRISKTHGYGRPNGDVYVWGANGGVASTAYILMQAYRFTGDREYLHATHSALDHLLGRNFQARSFVTGVGFNPPVNPHCRRSIAQQLVGSKPWPGYLVGGPTDQAMQAAPAGATCPDGPARCYFDYYPDYARNEIAMNWNSAMIYALAAMLPGADAYPVIPYPGEPDNQLSARDVSRPQTQRPGVTPRVRVTRVVQTGNRHLNIPPNSRVYTINGRLVATRDAGENSPMPNIRSRGVYIVRTYNQ